MSHAVTPDADTRGNTLDPTIGPVAKEHSSLGSVRDSQNADLGPLIWVCRSGYGYRVRLCDEQIGFSFARFEGTRASQHAVPRHPGCAAADLTRSLPEGQGRGIPNYLGAQSHFETESRDSRISSILRHQLDRKFAARAP